MIAIMRINNLRMNATDTRAFMVTGILYQAFCSGDVQKQQNHNENNSAFDQILAGSDRRVKDSLIRTSSAW